MIEQVAGSNRIVQRVSDSSSGIGFLNGDRNAQQESYRIAQEWYRCSAGIGLFSGYRIVHQEGYRIVEHCSEQESHLIVHRAIAFFS
jgi:hypothetical protein